MNELSLLTGADSKGEKLYVDSVFSAFTYTGNGGTQTINNGIDLAGKGGMVWLKCRTAAEPNFIVDSVRGLITDKLLITNTTGAETVDYGPALTGVSTTGYTIGNNGHFNSTFENRKYVNWTFRKAPKFFDILTYTGDGVAGRQIPHALGIAPGMVATKSTGAVGDWNTFHQSATGDLALNTTAAQTASKAIIPAASATTFTVSGVANSSGVAYVAYLYAHDTSADGIIQCGSFTCDASIGKADVNLGWEPQFLLIKRVESTGNCSVADSARGILTDGSGGTVFSPVLYANTSAAETTGGFAPTATGFKAYIAPNAVMVYIAIRRSNKPPTLGTQVYNAIARTGTGAAATVTGVGFAPDLVITKNRDNTYAPTLLDRLRGGMKELYSAFTAAEASVTSSFDAFAMDGLSVSAGVGGEVNRSGLTYINHCFKRAVGVFDEVCYIGAGVTKTEAHGLGVVPELIIVKNRTTGYGWNVYSSALGATKRLFLNATSAEQVLLAPWNDASPTANVFTVGTAADTNSSGELLVAYLFASKAGISKVFSYTGNGTSQTIDCAFATGARFVLIKRTDAAGDWYIWDTVRGIVASNDPHLSLNSTAAEVTTNDSIDPHTSGFNINQDAATNINVNTATYIGLAYS